MSSKFIDSYNFVVKKFFETVTFLGSPVFYGVIFLFLLQANFEFAKRLFVVMVIIEFVGFFVKIIYFRSRPNKRSYKNLVEKFDAGSFPSIHSARIVALSILTVWFFFSWYLVFFGFWLSVLVCYSRIYLREHYLGDVVGGIFLGAIVALGILFYL